MNFSRSVTSTTYCTVKATRTSDSCLFRRYNKSTVEFKPRTTIHHYVRRMSRDAPATAAIIMKQTTCSWTCTEIPLKRHPQETGELLSRLTRKKKSFRCPILNHYYSLIFQKDRLHPNEAT